ncbi:MAG: hypothetical protein R6V62_08210 [Candidatus Fermentibacteraceae bacterium]
MTSRVSVSWIVTLFMVGAVLADPTPDPDYIDDGGSLLQTFEVTVHVERGFSGDSLQSWILYGGPTLVYVWSPEDLRGPGLGLELGGELRRSLRRPLSGPFLGAYTGVGILWRMDENASEAVTAGVKMGWRIPVSSGSPLDIEPYAGVGIRLLSLSGGRESSSLHGILYLGLKLDIIR